MFCPDRALYKWGLCERGCLQFIYLKKVFSVSFCISLYTAKLKHPLKIKILRSELKDWTMNLILNVLGCQRDISLLFTSFIWVFLFLFFLNQGALGKWKTLRQWRWKSPDTRMTTKQEFFLNCQPFKEPLSLLTKNSVSVFMWWRLILYVLLLSIFDIFLLFKWERFHQ